MRVLREVGITVFIAVAVFVVLQLNVQSYTVEGHSMVPNIQEREYIMANKVAYRSSGPQAGQVIIFYPPDPPVSSERPFIKRVIGLPGETVEIRDGKVFVDGRPLEEPVTIPSTNREMPPTEVPEDHYFVLGDNRNSSRDSSEGWFVPRENIVGKAWFTYWPPNEWGRVIHYQYP